MSRTATPTWRVLGGGQRLGAAGGGRVRDLRLVEHLPDHLAEEALVVHDQDPRGLLRHGTPIGRSAYKMYRERSSSRTRSAEPRPHEGPSIASRRSAQVRRVEADLLEQALHHGVEAPRADVLGARVHRRRDLGERAHAVGRELELDALGGEQRAVLAHQRVARLGEDADEVLLARGSPARRGSGSAPAARGSGPRASRRGRRRRR